MCQFADPLQFVLQVTMKFLSLACMAVSIQAKCTELTHRCNILFLAIQNNPLTFHKKSYTHTYIHTYGLPCLLVEMHKTSILSFI